jgi:4-alpha-glucanotransferase
VQIIGDLPIYAALESADCWAHPEYFQLGGDGTPTKVSGAPPDSFCPNGQIWGNPLYDWDIMKRWDYGWWIDRVRHNLRIYDVVRLDHMRGFESYFAIPAGDKDAHNGQWEQGPGSEFFRVLREELGDCDMIAEDLGIITPEVEAMVKDSEMPGMRVLQFGFDGDPQNMHLPANYDGNVVVYTGTHDNDTTLGWYEKAEDWKQRFVAWYLREKSEIPQERKDELFNHVCATDIAPGERPSADEILDPETAVKGLIELAHSSRCDTCIIPMQDYLLLGSEARTNVPGVAKGNWRWQMPANACNQKLAATIGEVTARYGR